MLTKHLREENRENRGIAVLVEKMKKNFLKFMKCINSQEREGNI